MAQMAPVLPHPALRTQTVRYVRSCSKWLKRHYNFYVSRVHIEKKIKSLDYYFKLAQCTTVTL